MEAKQFKYAALTESLIDCPPANYEAIQMLAFRFVREDLNHPDNFKPVKVQQPNRHFDNDKANCAAFGLSMFSEKEKAKAFFHQRQLKFPRFSAIVGNHLATIPIFLEDGVASQPEELNFGHFTFHEYLWCDFVKRTTATEPI